MDASVQLSVPRDVPDGRPPVETVFSGRFRITNAVSDDRKVLRLLPTSDWTVP